jgi:hypothetical protein
MLTLFKQSQKIGLVGTLTAVFVWLAVLAIAMELVVNGLSQHPRLASVAVFGLLVVAAISGLVGFWLVTDHVQYRWLGYRVKWRRGNQWVYEERRAKFGVPYVRKVRGPGYPEPCTIRIPNAVAWKTEAPAWAQTRRDEIVGRIVTCHGAQNGGDIQVQEMNAVAEPDDARESPS